MKNKVIKFKVSGKFAVGYGTGKNERFYTDEVYATREEAEERAMVCTVSDLHIKMEDAYEKLQKKYPM